jgi:hypothetical protein
MKRLGFLTALTWGAWALMAPFDSWFYLPGFHHPATDPRHSIEKLAAVLSFLMILAVLCRPIRKLPGFLGALSQETLTIYALHLLLIYYPGIDLARRFDHALGLPAALACSAGMMAATLSATYFWHRFKKGRTGRRVVPRKGSSDPG